MSGSTESVPAVVVAPPAKPLISSKAKVGLTVSTAFVVFGLGVAATHKYLGSSDLLGASWRSVVAGDVLSAAVPTLAAYVALKDTGEAPASTPAAAAVASPTVEGDDEGDSSAAASVTVAAPAPSDAGDATATGGVAAAVVVEGGEGAPPPEAAADESEGITLGSAAMWAFNHYPPVWAIKTVWSHLSEKPAEATE